MPVRIRNVVPEFLSFWETARTMGPDEQKKLWLDLYEEPNRDLFDVYYSRWGSPRGLPAALKRFPEVVPRLESIDVGSSLQRGVAECARLFDHPEGEFDYIVMVGLFSSNGWATTVNGRPASFVALEWFSDQRYLDVLVAHEAAHAYHELTRAGGWTEFHFAQALFEEGLATLVSSLAVPGLSADEYLWFGAGYADWLHRCAQVDDVERRSLLSAANQTDQALYEQYFMARATEGLPQRYGYHVGYQIVSELHKTHTVAEMARWSAGEAVSAVTEALEQTDRR